MAGYDTSKLNLVRPGLTGSVPSEWFYLTTDAHATVDTSGYISDAKNRGLKVGDIIWVQKTDDAALLTKTHVVITISAAGAADLSDGTSVAGTANTD